MNDYLGMSAAWRNLVHPNVTHKVSTFRMFALNAKFSFAAMTNGATFAGKNHIELDLVKFRENQLIHDHGHDLKKRNRQNISNESKQRAKAWMGMKPMALMHNVLQENSLEMNTLDIEDVDYIRKNIYNSKRKNMPPLPKALKKVHDVVRTIT